MAAGIGIDFYSINPLSATSEGWPGHKVAEKLIVQMVRDEFEWKWWAIYEQFEYLQTKIPTSPRQEEIRLILEHEARTSMVHAKPDILLISVAGDYLDVAEIGTRRYEKQSQLYDRLIWWQVCLDARDAGCLVRPLNWRPPRGIIGSVENTLICTEPTWRGDAPDGVILYELHTERPAREQVRVKAPVRIPAPRWDDPEAIPHVRSEHPQLYEEVTRRAVPRYLIAAVVMLAAVLVFTGVPSPIAVEMAIAVIVQQRTDPDVAIRNAHWT